jgi:hypothetical protein
MINSFEFILEIFFPKNHCQIPVRTIFVWTLYSIKYGMSVISDWYEQNEVNGRFVHKWHFFSINAILFEQKCTETSSRQYCTKIFDSLQYWIVSYSCEQNVLLLTTAKEIYLSYSVHVVNEWFRFILFINFKLQYKNSILGFSN